MDELLEQFLLEGRDLVAQAASEFAVLADRPSDAEAIDGAFRAVHTLKGSVAIFAMAPAERVLHFAEDILETARKGQRSLEPELLLGLVAALDQVDRWIDEMEHSGALSPAADAIGERLTKTLSSQPLPATAVIDAAVLAQSWMNDLADRHAAQIEAATGALTMFRYTPDADCFFRGEDPLALAAAVPELLALAISPVADAWPEPDTFEPFVCASLLEGISGADPASVRTAFRMVPDHVEIATFAARETDRGTRRDTRSADVLRVAAARIDALADSLGELIVAVNAAAGLAEDAAQIDRAFGGRVQVVQAKLEQVTARLHRELSSVRAVVLESALRRLPRLVREIAESLGKTIAFTIEGDDIEVDKQIADGLFEPLLHLLRNAVDHGAEDATVRLAAGKPELCTISLRFARSGDAIQATLSDDGGGIDPARIREIAVSRELLPVGDVAALSDAEALRLIFLPGFSTADQITSVSGRGVGMDAVQSAIERMRGTLDVESEAGRGTTFRMRLPVSALTTPLLVVRVGAAKFGVALDQIVEMVRIDAANLHTVGGGQACALRGRTVPVVGLGALVGEPVADEPVARMLVTQAAGDRVALRVDGFGERFNAFVKPGAGMLAAVPGVAGSTLLGDGSVLLVLDLPELLA